MLRLVPYTSCADGAYGAVAFLAAATLAVFGVGFPTLCSWALWQPHLAPLVDFLQRPVRTAWWRPLWGGPVRFVRKLLFAAIVSGSDFGPTSLPMSVFVALLALLLLQVRSDPSMRVSHC